MSREALQRSANWVTAFGVGLILVGCLAIAAPLATGIAIESLVGTLFLLGGLAELIYAIRAGAFGVNAPERDLYLSPGHAVCVDAMGEVFVPVGQLINGDSIAPEEVDDVVYWHVELESHDVLLAEGLACESYMDAGNRAFI